MFWMKGKKERSLPNRWQKRGDNEGQSVIGKARDSSKPYFNPSNANPEILCLNITRAPQELRASTSSILESSQLRSFPQSQTLQHTTPLELSPPHQIDLATFPPAQAAIAPSPHELPDPPYAPSLFYETPPPSSNSRTSGKEHLGIPQVLLTIYYNAS